VGVAGWEAAGALPAVGVKVFTCTSTGANVAVDERVAEVDWAISIVQPLRRKIKGNIMLIYRHIFRMPVI
jgi:hypothetical protein